MVLSPDGNRVSYLINVWAPQLYLGAYDIANQRRLGEAEADGEALRREIGSKYRGTRGFPLDGTEDLLEWAKDPNGCQEAFHERYGYR